MQALVALDPGSATRLSEATGDGAIEALHLRRLIEQQPACLLRVGLDGLLLAVNQAALGLLAGDTLSQVLGSNLTKLMMARQHEEWREFAARVGDGASGSLECDLTDLSGTRRSLLLQGVPLLDHADGVPSMILSARDISVPRRLEAALREREISRELDDLQKQLRQGFSDASQTESVHNDHEIDLQPLIAEDAAERQLLLQTLAEEHQAELSLKEREAQGQVDGIRIELEAARAEQQRLATLLEDHEIGHQRMLATHARECAQLQQTLAEEHQLALLLKERDGRQLLAALRTELQETFAVQHQHVVSEHDAKRAEAEQALVIAVTKQAEIEKTLADQRVELQTVEENARNLEWMALSGRAAIAVGRELQTIMAAVEARTKHMLVQTALGADNRHVIEGLRCDAIDAASLARQILQVNGQNPLIEDSPESPTARSCAPVDAPREL